MVQGQHGVLQVTDDDDDILGLMIFRLRMFKINNVATDHMYCTIYDVIMMMIMMIMILISLPDMFPRTDPELRGLMLTE